ncbi:uncharacterized protein LOC118745695 [Rhagoletis pomonella]|uniref:uncharacterized protein LOC118745695 n=1 Tax=Rhagoletis pomonella TaxID=28610 RepID=UPI0017849351|nr:uncharacterized protein LOC118745695 [Rhagoletis pomonella]
MEKTTRRRWTREESEGFLQWYMARKAEFEQPKKKRQAYANTLEDMISLGITDFGRTPLCLEGRMCTLLQAYKTARDNNNRTGSSPFFAPYMELMEEIFGSSPIISNSHTLQLGDGPVQMIEESSPIPAPSPPPNSTTSSPLSQSPLPSTSSSLSQSPLPLISSLPMSPTPAERKRSARELYYEEKLKLKKKAFEKKKLNNGKKSSQQRRSCFGKNGKRTGK